MSEQPLSTLPETATPIPEDGHAAPSAVRSTKSWNRKVALFAILLSVIAFFGYPFVSVPIPMFVWWTGPLFFGLLFVAVVTYRFLSKRQAKPDEETVNPSKKAWKIGKRPLFVVYILMAACLVLGGFALFQGPISVPTLPHWIWPTLFAGLLAVALIPSLYRSFSGILIRTGRNDESLETKASSWKIDKKQMFMVGGLLIGCALIGSIGSFFFQNGFQLSAFSWWVGPSFWCVLIVVATMPSTYRMIRTVRFSKETVGKTLAVRHKSVPVIIGIVSIVLIAFLVFLVACYPETIRVPGLAWWNGIAFWSMVIAAVTTPRIYWSLPKTGGSAAGRILSQGAGSTSWLLLIGILFLVNAILIRNPDSQDAFIADALRLFDTRFFSIWHWLFFLLGAGGFFARYCLETKVMLAERSKKPSGNLPLACQWATICGSTFTVVFLCSKFSLISSVVSLPFQPNFPLKYWSVIWILLTLELFFFIGIQYRLFDNMMTFFVPKRSLSFRAIPLPTLGFIALGLVIAAGIGVFAWNNVTFSELPWWVAPAFWSLVISLVFSPRVYQSLPPGLAFAGRSRTDDRNRNRFHFGRIAYLVVTLIAVCVCVIGLAVYAFASGTIRFSDFPWWSGPVFWGMLILAVVFPKMYETIRRNATVDLSFLKPSASNHSLCPKWSRRVYMLFSLVGVCLCLIVSAVYAFASGIVRFSDFPWWTGPVFWTLLIALVVSPKIFETLQKTTHSVLAGSKRVRNTLPVSSNFSKRTFIAVIGTVVCLCLIGTVVYVFASGKMRFSDLPGWTIPAFWTMVIIGGVSYKIIEAVRSYRKDAPVRPKRPVKAATKTTSRPITFNTARSTTGFSIPKFDAPVWIGLAAAFGVVLLVFFCYTFLSSPRLDEDGHPIAWSWWVWPLLILCVSLAAAAYPIFQSIREHRANSFSSSNRPAIKPKTNRSTSFNTAAKKSVTKTGSTWTFPSLPRLEGWDRWLPMAGIGGVAVIGTVIIAYALYCLSTLERIDADGHPVSMPSWVVPSLFVLVALAVVGYKVVAGLRVDSGSSFRSSTYRSVSVKQGKPVGFNAAGFGKKKTGFNRQNNENRFSNPILWLGVLGGAVVVLLLVIVFILVF